MLLLNPRIAEARSDVEEPLFVHILRDSAAAARGSPARSGEGSCPERSASPALAPDAARECLLEYAAFVLDQEAEYCQQ
jgi:hypothetical protein